MKRTVKKVMTIALTMVCATSLYACGSTSTKTESSTIVASVASETQYPVTINTYDANGNQITQTFEKAPERIVTNNLSATETLIELGLQDKIVGMMTPDNEVTSYYQSSIEQITKLGDKKSISKEVVLSATPDIIVGRAAMFSENSLGTYLSWNENEINVYAQGASISASTVSLSSVIEDVKNLGVIFNVQDKANAYADELQEKLDKVVAETSTTAELKNALVMCAYDGNTFGAYKSALQEQMLNTLGYTNKATGTSGLSLENLITMDPEVIVYVTSDRNAKNDATAVEDLYNQESLADVPAIKNKKIITIGYDEFMDYGPAVFDALTTLSDALK